MKCDNCPALVWEGYEYPEPHCSVGFEEDSRDFADGSEGCLHRLSTIKKRLAVYEEYEAHRYDGIGEFYERECKIEDAMADAIIKACELAEIVFASEGEDGLYKYRMSKEIPSALTEFAWRFRAELEDLGYMITERQQTTND